MDLKVDHPVCNGHGRFYVLAPELFQSGYYGYSVVITEDVLRVPGKDARSARAICPERAISFH